jgi:hypothetical protein
VRTISNLLNRQDYRLRTVAKSKVQKKASSVKFMGKLRLGQFAKCMI